MLCPFCKIDTVNIVFNPEFITGIENEETILQCEKCLRYWSVDDYKKE